MDLLETLQSNFGHAEFRPGQEAVIRSLVEGESALALFPTGAGKSLCYQLPALVRDGTALVISPLIALMKDQVDALRAKGIAAARLDSSLSAAETQQVYADLREGRLKLLYVAPERLSGETFLERLRRVKISLLAIDAAARQINEPRERVVKALTWLEETGAITQKPAGLRHGFRLCGDPVRRDPAAVAARLAELFGRREERDSQRLAQILDFAGQSGCITRRLLAYFGETLDEANCGHCHYCRTGVPSEPVCLPATVVAPFAEAHAVEVRALLSQGNRALSTPRQVTRFLCGLTSPATTRSKLTRRPEFGRFSAVPFRTVLEWVKRQA